MRIKGVIHYVDIFNKLITIKQNKRVIYFYFANSQLNIFRRYLYEGVWIDMEYDENKTHIKHGATSYQVQFVYKVFSPGVKDGIVYYDKRFLNTSLSSFMKSLGNLLVVDFEMTMPDYHIQKGEPFRAELIQAGYVVLNSSGEELYRYSNYIKPTLSDTISKRVEKFLNIKADDFNMKAVPYSEFYKDFEESIDTYNPSIVIFGKNDAIVLKDSYKVNNMPDITKNTRFVNLCQLIKSYYDLKNDPGLFRLYKVYNEVEDVQVHDAFDDCEATVNVFKAFKDEVDQKTNRAEIIRRIFD